MDPWIIEAADDAVEVVGAEGPGEFSIYGILGTVVEPNLGNKMLRKGVPKTQNETQNRGFNTIAQTFEATGENLSIALRLFSLDHRGDDTLRISLTSASGESVPSTNAFDFGNGATCQAPCEQIIDAGKRKDVIATDWQVLSFSGLIQGESYTLNVELEAGQNESLASWLYVDSVNEAPSAVIRFNPTGPIESDYVVFDCLQSVDPENNELLCRWTGDFDGTPLPEVVGETVVYSFPDNGVATVNLEVSDGEISTTTSTSVNVANQTPLVNALNVEVLPDGTVELLCRFVDPGAGDTHTVDFSVGAGEILDDFIFEEENVPALSSGYARVSYRAPPDIGTISGSCDVTDSSGGPVGSDAFEIYVLDPGEFQTRVAGNTGSTQGTPQVIPTDQSSLGGLIEPESVAVYEIRLPNGDPIPAGTEIIVTAQFPVDFDIVLLNGTFDTTVTAAPWVSAPFVSAPFVSAPFVSVPFVSAPFVSAPFVSAPFVSAPFVSVPFVSAPFVSAPFVSAPFVSAPITVSPWLSPGFQATNFPFSQLAGAPDGSNISAVDVSFYDLGAEGAGSLVNEPVFVKGLSAEFGDNPEQLLIKVGPGEDGLFLAVIPQGGSFSAAPYSMQVEGAVPPDPVQLLGAACNSEPLVEAGSQTDTVDVLRDYGDNTLIVTQKQRMMTTFGMDETAWNNWLSLMDPFLSQVQAKMISVPSVWYNTADSNPCVVAEQNALASSIKTAIDQYRTENTEYVQLMGSLDIVPAYFLPDETQTGNESLFASDLLIEPATPLAVGIAQGNMLTDAFYVDDTPQPLNGRLLYIEDISVSRMVETPEEILANAQRFVATGGVINLLSVEAATPGAGTQSTGYDFFIDGTEVINSILVADYPVPNTTSNDDTWDAATLRCQFFGAGEGCTKPVSAVNAVNAHMSYNAGLTAKGFNCAYLPETERPPGLDCSTVTDPLGEVFLSTESSSMFDDPDDIGPAIDIFGITFSIGCHSGLSVPDAWGLPEELGLPLDPAKDWVQELGNWVGAYNFAYGDTEVADRGTEGIMPLVIANFAQGMTLGHALIQAKWQYGAGLFEFGVYDEKSLVGLGLFGMPQATLEASVGASFAAAVPSSQTVGSATGDQLVVDYEELGTVTTTGGSIDMHANDKGIWYSIDGNAQAILGRPLLPVIKPFELRPVGETSVHGVALLGGAYTTYLDQDPVFPAQTHDLVTEIGEPQPCVETLSPSLIALVNSFESPDGVLQSFIVQPGQFQCTDTPEQQAADGYQVNGNFRIWNDIDLELQHPATVPLDADRQPPEVNQQDLLGDPMTGIVTATLDAQDANGIRKVIALVFRDDDGLPGGTGTATPYITTERNGDGVFELSLPDAFDNLISLQYVDNAGNITAKTLKGALLRAIEVAIRTTIINLGGITQIIVEISDFESLTAPFMKIDFGLGDEPLVLELNDPSLYELNPDGTAVVVVEYDYSDLTLPSVTVAVEVRAAGAVGTDEKTISACGDEQGDVSIPSADIIGCSVNSEGTNLTLDVVLDGPVDPSIQYRLVLPATNTQIKYSDGAVQGPKQLKPSAVVVAENQISFSIDAAKLGWDGISPIDFQFETQDGVSGGQSQGFIDTTEVKTYQQ